MIEESPATVLSVAALAAGTGRVWQNDGALLVESPLTPGEPEGFGAPEAILDLLGEADHWTCLVVDGACAAALREGFAARFGLARTLVGLVHTLEGPPDPVSFDGLHALSRDELLRVEVPAENLWLRDETALSAATAGRVFGVVTDGALRGHCGAFAVGEQYADLGVHVTESFRRRGLATAAAAAACRAVQSEGRVPVWGCSEENVSSRGVAMKLGFTLVGAVTYLVRG